MVLVGFVACLLSSQKCTNDLGNTKLDHWYTFTHTKRDAKRDKFKA